MSDKKPYQYTYNKKNQDYIVKYVKDHYDRINLRLPKGYGDLIRQAAESKGQSVTKYIQDLIDKELKKD